MDVFTHVITTTKDSNFLITPEGSLAIFVLVPQNIPLALGSCWSSFWH